MPPSLPLAAHQAAAATRGHSSRRCCESREGEAGETEKWEKLVGKGIKKPMAGKMRHPQPRSEEKQVVNWSRNKQFGCELHCFFVPWAFMLPPNRISGSQSNFPGCVFTWHITLTTKPLSFPHNKSSRTSHSMFSPCSRVLYLLSAGIGACLS